MRQALLSLLVLTFFAGMIALATGTGCNGSSNPGIDGGDAATDASGQ